MTVSSSKAIIDCRNLESIEINGNQGNPKCISFGDTTHLTSMRLNEITQPITIEHTTLFSNLRRIALNFTNINTQNLMDIFLSSPKLKQFRFYFFAKKHLFSLALDAKLHITHGFLEELELENCSTVENLIVEAPSLRTIILRNCSVMKNVALKAPKLMLLDLFGLQRLKFSSFMENSNIPSLERMALDFHNIELNDFIYGMHRLVFYKSLRLLIVKWINNLQKPLVESAMERMFPSCAVITHKT